MKLPFVIKLRKTIEAERSDTQRVIDALTETTIRLEETAFRSAKEEIAAQLRELLVDANYEMFYSSDSLLRPKLYAFMSTALAQFHNKAQRSKNA